MVNKMREARLRQFGHLKRRCIYILVMMCERLVMVGLRRGRCRRKKYWGRGQIGHAYFSLPMGNDIIVDMKVWNSQTRIEGWQISQHCLAFRLDKLDGSWSTASIVSVNFFTVVLAFNLIVYCLRFFVTIGVSCASIIALFRCCYSSSFFECYEVLSFRLPYLLHFRISFLFLFQTALKCFSLSHGSSKNSLFTS